MSKQFSTVVPYLFPTTPVSRHKQDASDDTLVNDDTLVHNNKRTQSSLMGKLLRMVNKKGTQTQLEFDEMDMQELEDMGGPHKKGSQA